MAEVSLGNTANARGLFHAATQHIIQSNTGILFLITIDNSNSKIIKFKKSSDGGATWDADWTTALTTTYGNSNLSIYHDTSDDSILLAFLNTWDNNSSFSKGTFSEGTWTFSEPVIVLSYGGQAVSITKDASGNIWMGSSYSPSQVYVKYSTDGGANWTSAGSNTPINSYANSGACMYPIGSYAAYFTNVEYLNQVAYAVWNGAGWDGTVTVVQNITSPSGTREFNFGAAVISATNIWCAAMTSSGIKVFHYTGSWDAGTLISDNAADESPSIVIISGKPVVVFRHYDGTYYQISYCKYNGASWDARVDLTTGTNTQNSPTSTVITGGMGVARLQGTSAPYTVYFENIPLGDAPFLPKTMMVG